MSHLTLAEGGPGQISKEELASLLKRTLESDFQMNKNQTLSSLLDKKRRLKRKRKPSYRKINRYYKSIKKFKEERERRKQVLHLWMVEFRTQKEIAAKLGGSVSTVKRDQKKLRRFVRGQMNRARQLMRMERWRGMEELSLKEQFDRLSEEMERVKKLAPRLYKGHYTVLYLDLTQADQYGIPKLKILPTQTKGQPLAYPHSVQVHIKAEYEGRPFEAYIGGFTITQTTLPWWRR